MKRKQLIKHIKKYDGFLLREGSNTVSIKKED